MGKFEKSAINTTLIALALTFAFLAAGCGSSRSPLERLKRDLAKYPEYSIILEDMKEDGNFFTDYFHRYKYVYGEATGHGDTLTYQNDITEWQRLEEKEYRKYENFLGMILVSKTADGKVSDVQYPPGYQYVGDSRYGTWRTDSHGNSFWEFYGKYALISSMFGMFNRPIYRNDWNDYRDYRGRGQTYYGPNREYGTNGTQTKQTHKSFFDRRVERDRQKKSSFSQKVQQRTRRSNMSGTRSRSRGGSGK